jgi:hypothetical protein
MLVSPFFKRDSLHVGSKEHAFFNTQLGQYAACLLVGNLFTGAAGILVGNWIARGGIGEGSICAAQAVLMQVGNWVNAYFTLAMAIHTCITLVFRWPQKRRFGATVIAMGWLSAVAVGFAPVKMANSTVGPAYGFDGFSCGIKRVYPVPEFVFHLLPIFFAATLSVVIYSLIYLALRGTLVLRGGFKINLDPQQRWSGRQAFGEYHRFIRAVGKSMLWFPVAYVILLLPYSIAKLLDLSGYPVAFGVNVFAETSVAMLGLANVCILHNTLRVLEPAFETRPMPSTFYDTDTERSDSPSEKPPSFPQPAVLTSRVLKFISFQSNSQSVQPSWQLPANNHAVPGPSSSTLTHQKSVSGASSSSSLRLLIPGRDNYDGHAGSSSLRSSTAESIGRSITSISELNKAIVVEPHSISQKSSAGTSNVRLQYNHSRTSTAESLESLSSLSPAPRNTRSPVSRRPNIETILSVSPSKDRGSNADLQKSDASGAHSRSISVSSVSSSLRESFGVQLSPSPVTQMGQLNVSGAHIRQASDSSLRSKEETLMSDSHVSFSTVASKPTPATSSSPATVPSPSEYDASDSEAGFSPPPPTLSHVRHQAQVPSDVDSDDFGSAPVPVAFNAVGDTLSKEPRSPTENVSSEGSTSLAWATLVANAATSNGSFSAQRRAPSRDADNGVLSVPQVLQPRTAASANSTHNGVIDTADRREDIDTSAVLGDLDVQVRQGPSKKAALASKPSTSRRTDLARAPSSAAEQYYI